MVALDEQHLDHVPPIVFRSSVLFSTTTSGVVNSVRWPGVRSPSPCKYGGDRRAQAILAH